ncbi:hypothetical protein STENM327S_02730 [Streptomyces tendae]
MGTGTNERRTSRSTNGERARDRPRRGQDHPTGTRSGGTGALLAPGDGPEGASVPGGDHSPRRARVLGGTRVRAGSGSRRDQGPEEARALRAARPRLDGDRAGHGQGTDRARHGTDRRHGPRGGTHAAHGPRGPGHGTRRSRSRRPWRCGPGRRGPRSRPLRPALPRRRAAGAARTVRRTRRRRGPLTRGTGRRRPRPPGRGERLLGPARPDHRTRSPGRGPRRGRPPARADRRAGRRRAGAPSLRRLVGTVRTTAGQARLPRPDTGRVRRRTRTPTSARCATRSAPKASATPRNWRTS